MLPEFAKSYRDVAKFCRNVGQIVAEVCRNSSNFCANFENVSTFNKWLCRETFWNCARAECAFFPRTQLRSACAAAAVEKPLWFGGPRALMRRACARTSAASGSPGLFDTKLLTRGRGRSISTYATLFSNCTYLYCDKMSAEIQFRIVSNVYNIVNIRWLSVIVWDFLQLQRNSMIVSA